MSCFRDLESAVDPRLRLSYTRCIMATPPLRGIDFLLDASGRKKAVQIDLRRHGEVWEDIYDSLIAEQRRTEPRESLAAVRRRLETQRRRSA
jgi:hypothetical protein